MRFFERINYEQFKKDIADDKKLYEEMKLPVRGTAAAAGYDLPLLFDVTLEPGELKKIPTGLKAKYGHDEVMLIVVRSRMGFKYNIRLCNQVGVIDADYYNNPDNDGHLWIRVQNEGAEAVTIKKGDAIAQCIFVKYLTTTNDSPIKQQRASDK